MRTLIGNGDVTREEIFVASKNGYIPDDSDNGKSASMLVEELIEDNLITKEDIAADIHCMHPSYLNHQLQASQKNLGLKTIDLMYLHNAYESWSHFSPDIDSFYDKLAQSFEFYESKR